MDNVYIHFTEFNIETIDSIFRNGIMFKYNLQKNGIYKKAGIGSNGKYYVSLTKKSNQKKCVYSALSKSNAYIGIKVKLKKEPIKAKIQNTAIFTNTIIPIRYSPYNNEWQTKEIITPDQFMELSYPLDYISEVFKNNKEYLESTIEKINEIKELMKIYNIDIPLRTEKVYTK